MSEKDLRLLAEDYDVELDHNQIKLLIAVYRIGLQDALGCITDEVNRLEWLLKRELL